MKQDVSQRQLREAAHQHKYAIVAGDSCTYCGTKVNPVGQGSAGDHVPPLAVLDANFGIAVGDMKIVPCCSACNSKLGASALVTVGLRRSHIVYETAYAGKSEVSVASIAHYNATINEGFKRSEGQVDTPDVVAEQILDKLPLLGSLCDPACGDGSFVRMQIKRLITAGISHDWIEDNIRGYDNDVEMVGEAIRRLRKEFPGLNGKEIFKVKDFFDMEEHFDTIAMNPPFGKKGDRSQDGLWQRFAEKAIKHCDNLAVIAPLRIRSWDFGGKGRVHVLMEQIDDFGISTPPCAVLWARSDEFVSPIKMVRAMENQVRFDVCFFNVDIRQANAGKPGFVTYARNSDGQMIGVSKKAFDERRLAALDYVAISLRQACRHIIERGHLPNGQRLLVRGSGVESFLEFIHTKDGMALLESMAVMKDHGYCHVDADTLNKAFSSRVKK